MKKLIQLIAHCSWSAQKIVLTEEVIDYLYIHRQNRCYKREAGGQLFGVLNEAGIIITQATGPYHGDFRTRFAYRSNPGRAQQEIKRQRELGLYYCGDWHTHPESRPKASSEDFATISNLVQLSDTRLNTLIMIIQGTSAEPNGIAIYSSDGGTPIKWKAEVLKWRF